MMTLFGIMYACENIFLALKAIKEEEIIYLKKIYRMLFETMLNKVAVVSEKHC